MSENFNRFAKDSASVETIETRTTKSEDLPRRGKERKRLWKKKMLRSADKWRLRGGADSETAAAEDEEVKDEPEDPASSEKAAEEAMMPDIQRGSFDQSIRQPLPSTGDPRVDEMLECALQNLNEAGKALGSLSENVEHELKLFLVELMNRIRKWSSQVEGKIDWARKDILELHKELAKGIFALSESRRESAELKQMLANSENAKSIAQKSLTDTLMSPQKHIGRFEQEETGTQAGSRSLAGPTHSMQLDGKSVSSQMPINSPVDEERMRQCCAELEAELMELRKENEKIVKERAEYENAIQRALLKGVSSLNVEALKVLRCTPIPTCCPPPCPPSTTIEPVSKRDCNGGGGGASERKSPRGCGASRSANCNGSRDTFNNGCGGGGGSGGGNGYNGNGGGGNRRTCPSAGQSERKSRKARDNNMLLLLHQKDAENFGINGGNGACDNATKKTTICGGGNCGKNGKSSNYMC